MGKMKRNLDPVTFAALFAIVAISALFIVLASIKTPMQAMCEEWMPGAKHHYVGDLHLCVYHDEHEDAMRARTLESVIREVMGSTEGSEDEND